MMTREMFQKKDSCCPSRIPTQKQSIFVPRPFAPKIEEHEPPAAGPVTGFNFADISIFPRETIQPKLVLGPVGDKYEQEADRVARRVVESVSSSDQGAVQRQEDLEDEGELEEPLEEEEEEELRRKVEASSAAGGADVGPDLESAIRGARSGGQPLSDGVRQPMERAFGADFGGVRVHADGEADRLNRSLQARAFTTGQDVFLRRGEYRPGSSAGQRLLAHELTHVVQQNQELIRPSMHVKRTSINNGLRLNGENDDVWGGIIDKWSDFDEIHGGPTLIDRHIPPNRREPDRLACLDHMHHDIRSSASDDGSLRVIQMARVSIHQGNIPQSWITELQNIVQAAEYSGGRSTFEFDTNRFRTDEVPKTSQGTYAVGGSYSRITAGTAETGQYGIRILGPRYSVGTKAYSRSLKAEYLGSREPSMHGEMQLVREKGQGIQYAYATQDNCLFCHGYLHLHNIQHQELRRDPWPQIWRHPLGMFILQEGLAAVGNVVKIEFRGPDHYYQIRNGQ